MDNVYYKSKRAKSIIDQVLDSEKSPNDAIPRSTAFQVSNAVHVEHRGPQSLPPTTLRSSSMSQALKHKVPSRRPLQLTRPHSSTTSIPNAPIIETPHSSPLGSSSSRLNVPAGTSQPNALPPPVKSTSFKTSQPYKPFPLLHGNSLLSQTGEPRPPTLQNHKATHPQTRRSVTSEPMHSPTQNTMPHVTRETNEPPMEAQEEVSRGETRLPDGDPDDQENDHPKAKKAKKAKSNRPRHMKSRDVVPNWPDHIKYDAKEEVLTIDAQGKHKLLSGPIQPREVDMFDAGVRVIVNFNEFNQPIRKAGFVLVKYLGYMARNERFCPVGDKSWCHLRKQYKVEIIEVARSKLIVPTGELFDKAILMRVDKYWRQYKHHLKARYYDPNMKKEDVEEKIPDGIYHENWWKLVDYWYSEKGQKMSENGKKARNSLQFLHTTGCTSFANKRADFVDELTRPPSNLEFFEETHTTIDGDIESNSSRQFLDKANEKVAELVKIASPSKRIADIENEVFDELMYDGRPRRPVGYGLGVKQSTIFGVQGELRKKGYDATVIDNTLEVEGLKATVGNMRKENQALRAKVDQSNQILLEALNVIRTGHVSDEFFESAQMALRTASSQVGSASSGGGARRNVEEIATSPDAQN